MMKRSSLSCPDRTLTGPLLVVLLAWTMAAGFASPTLALEEATQPGFEPASPPPSRESWSGLMREARELRRVGNLRQAEERLLEAIAIGDHHGPAGQRVGTAFYQLNQIGEFYEARNQQEDILRLGPTLVLIGTQLLGPSDPRVQRHRAALVAARSATGDNENTQTALEDAVATSVGAERIQYQLALAARAIEGAIPEDAEPVLTTLLETIPAGTTGSERRTARIAALQLLGELRTLQRREAEAEPLLLEAVAEASSSAPGSLVEARAKNTLAAFYVEQDRSASADPLAREALAVAEAQSDSEFLQLEILDTLATSLARQERTEEAEETYARGLELAQQQAGPAAEELRVHYADWLRSRGRGEDADRIHPVALPADTPGEAPAPAG